MRKQLWSDVAGAGRGAQHPRDSTHGCEGTLWGPQFQLCQGPAGFGKQLLRSPLSGPQHGDPHSCPRSPGRDPPWDFWDCPAAGRKNPGMISLGKHLQDPQRGTRGGFRSWLIQGKLFFSRSQQPWRLLGRCLSPPSGAGNVLENQRVSCSSRGANVALGHGRSRATEGAFCWENGCGNYLESPCRFLFPPSFSQPFPNVIPGDSWVLEHHWGDPKAQIPALPALFQLFLPFSPLPPRCFPTLPIKRFRARLSGSSAAPQIPAGRL